MQLIRMMLRFAQWSVSENMRTVQPSLGCMAKTNSPNSLFLSYISPHKVISAQRIANWIKDLLSYTSWSKETPGSSGIYYSIHTINRKLLEKQRVYRTTLHVSYEVHTGHFFYNVSATVRFGKCLTLSVLRFKYFSPD